MVKTVNKSTGEQLAAFSELSSKKCNLYGALDENKGALSHSGRTSVSDVCQCFLFVASSFFPADSVYFGEFSIRRCFRSVSIRGSGRGCFEGLYKAHASPCLQLEIRYFMVVLVNQETIFYDRF